MKIELHLHTSRYSVCAINSPQEIMQGLVETGYDAVFITEHNSIWSDAELAELRAEFPKLLIFPGMELTNVDCPAGDILVLGSNDSEYLRLTADPAAILEKARHDGCLTVLAHPHRFEHCDGLLRAGLMPDAIEQRTGGTDANQAVLARVTAESMGLKLVNAGDVHAVEIINHFWIETAAPLENATDIREIVLAGAYENRMRSDYY